MSKEVIKKYGREWHRVTNEVMDGVDFASLWLVLPDINGDRIWMEHGKGTMFLATGERLYAYEF